MLPMKWGPNLQQDNLCVCCGRPLKEKLYWVEVIDGGNYVRGPEDEVDVCDPGYMGFFPVGLSCARRNFKDHYIKSDFNYDTQYF